TTARCGTPHGRDRGCHEWGSKATHSLIVNGNWLTDLCLEQKERLVSIDNQFHEIGKNPNPSTPRSGCMRLLAEAQFLP
ncbi:MAG: hypothetical protein ABI156_11360, partial [Caldimonas sp.]